MSDEEIVCACPHRNDLQPRAHLLVMALSQGAASVLKDVRALNPAAKKAIQLIEFHQLAGPDPGADEWQVCLDDLRAAVVEDL
jgi:hypothetical protein